MSCEEGDAKPLGCSASPQLSGAQLAERFPALRKHR